MKIIITEIDTEFKGILQDKYFKPFFKNEEALIDFINSYYKFRGINKTCSITNISLQHNIIPDKDKLKWYYADILVTMEDGEIVILEAYTYFGKREYAKSYSYACRTYSNQIKRGQRDYENNKKVTCLNLMTGNFRLCNERIINRYLTINKDNLQIIDNGEIELVLIRLDLCNNVNYNKSKERFIKWLKIINAKSFKEMANFAKGVRVMEQSVEFLKRYCTENFDHGFNSIMAKEKYEAVEKTTRENAKNFLKEGVSIKIIMKATGLSKAEINKLKNEV